VCCVCGFVDELRRLMRMPRSSIPGWRYSARLALVAQALTAAGAVDPGVAEEIRADVGLRRKVPVVAYVQSAVGARFIVTEWPFGPSCVLLTTPASVNSTT
jgi:hypothetical protein